MFIERKSLEPFDFGGLQIRDFTAGLETRSSLAIIEVPSGGSHPLALSKRSEKYYCVLAGKIRLTVDDEEREIGPNDVCVIRRGSPFKYKNASDEPAHLLLVHTPPFDLNSEVFLEGLAGQ